MNENTEWVRFDALRVGDRFTQNGTVLQVVGTDGIWIDVLDAAGSEQSLYTPGHTLVRRVH